MTNIALLQNGLTVGAILFALGLVGILARELRRELKNVTTHRRVVRIEEFIPRRRLAAPTTRDQLGFSRGTHARAA